MKTGGGINNNHRHHRINMARNENGNNVYVSLTNIGANISIWRDNIISSTYINNNIGALSMVFILVMMTFDD